MSCNGCRVLRKGCTDDCTIRPCLEWIKSADAQANATIFLAKFYGRAGLLNLISTGPEHLRPAIFRSLLYEACGRIINPVYGSIGLLWSGDWARCQSEVDAVLRGTSRYTSYPGLPALKYTSCDIRHIKKSASSTSRDHNAGSARHGSQYKRAKVHTNDVNGSNTGLWIYPTPIYEKTMAMSHHENIISLEYESNFSIETIEEALVVTEANDRQKMWKFSEPVVERMRAADGNSAIELDLTLGLKVHS